MGRAILLFFIGLFASTAGAISGIGGGVIIKPVLDATTDIGVTGISFLSGCTVFSMAVVSLLRGKRAGMELEARRGTMLAIGAAVGGVAGKLAFDSLKALWGGENMVGAAQSAILALMTLGVLVYVQYKHKIRVRSIQNTLSCLLLGLSLGILSSFLGIGGGPINIAVLSFFLAMDSKTSAFHSIYIILFSQAASFILTFATGSVPNLSALWLAAMIAGGVLGGLLGSHISRRLGNSGVDKLFSIVLILVILVSGYNFIGFIR